VSSTSRLARGSRTGRAPTTAGQRLAHQSDRFKKKMGAIVALGAGALVAAGLVYIVGGRGPTIDEARLNMAENALGDSVQLYEKREFIKSDETLHKKVLADKDLIRDEKRGKAIYQAAEAHDLEIHPLAEAQREADKVVPDWLARVKAMTNPAVEGPALFDEGEKYREKWPNCSYVEELDKHLSELSKFKQGGDDSFKKYQETAEATRQLRKQHKYGAALQAWIDLKGGMKDPIYLAKINARIAEINGEAKFRLDKLVREAERFHGDGSVAEGLKLLEDARPNLKGTEAEKDLEDRITAYKAKPAPQK
jgi:hypothetical protein